MEHRKLVIDDAEAKIVRHLFERYLALRSVRDLADEAARDGLVTRTRERQDGTVAVTMPFGRGNLYHLLSNPIYIGKIKHKDQFHDGEHEPIIAGAVFEKAQALLAAQAPRRRSSSNVSHLYLLTGLLFDEHGEKLRSVHANKRGVRYRYYVSKQFVDRRRGNFDGWRLPGDAVESVVEHQLNRILSDHSQIADLIQRWGVPGEIQYAIGRAAEVRAALSAEAADAKRSLLQKLIRSITLGQKALTITIDCRALSEHLLDRVLPSDGEAETVLITCPFDIKRRGVEMRIILRDTSSNSAEPDTALIDVVHRAQLYLHQVTDGSGRSLTDIASLNETTVSEVSRLLPLAFLSPKIVSKIIAGNQPIELTAHRLSRLSGLPLAWTDQSALLGL